MVCLVSLYDPSHRMVWLESWKEVQLITLVSRLLLMLSSRSPVRFRWRISASVSQDRQSASICDLGFDVQTSRRTKLRSFFAKFRTPHEYIAGWGQGLRIDRHSFRDYVATIVTLSTALRVVKYRETADGHVTISELDRPSMMFGCSGPLTALPSSASLC